MREPRALLFDLDGTLLDYDAAAWSLTVAHVAGSLAAAFPGLDADGLAESYRHSCDVLWSSPGPSPLHTVDGYAVWRSVWRAALAEHGRTDAVDLAVSLYGADRRRRYRLFPDVAETLSRLRPRVEAMAVITNGPADTQREKLAATGLADAFDLVLTSGEVRIAKPDPRIFLTALSRLGVAPSDAWYIGNSLRSDVAGALRANLAAAVWLNRSAAAGLTDTAAVPPAAVPPAAVSPAAVSPAAVPPAAVPSARAAVSARAAGPAPTLTVTSLGEFADHVESPG